jgi:hypothetical protein
LLLLLLLQVIRENMDVFKHNGFEFVEEEHLQRNHTAQHQASIPSSSADAANTSSPAAAAAADDNDGSAADAAADAAPGELLLSAVPLMHGAGANGVLGEEALTELLDLMATGERRPEDLRPKRYAVNATGCCSTSMLYTRNVISTGFCCILDLLCMPAVLRQPRRLI